MFWIAMYSVSTLSRPSKLEVQAYQPRFLPILQFPAAWILLLFVGILKFNLSFLPIVALALVFNLTNTVGYTYGESFILFPRKFVESPELTHSPCALRKRHIAVSSSSSGSVLHQTRIRTDCFMRTGSRRKTKMGNRNGREWNARFNGRFRWIDRDWTSKYSLFKILWLKLPPSLVVFCG